MSERGETAALFEPPRTIRFALAAPEIAAAPDKRKCRCGFAQVGTKPSRSPPTKSPEKRKAEESKLSKAFGKAPVQCTSAAGNFEQPP